MLILEGNIVNKNKVFRGRIEIDDHGIINKIGEPVGDADFVFGEELIFPGFIDLHVHAREDVSHKQDYKEDFSSAGLAAINGGVVAFADMPNNTVSPINDKSYEEKNFLAERSPVAVLLYAGIGPDTKPLKQKVPYKVFMGPSIGDLFFNSREDLERVLSQYSGQNVSFHCEEPKVLEENKEAPTHEARRPPEAEIFAIDFALYLIEKYKIIGKICHTSTLEGINKIISAKKRGLNVTIEVTPHHLYFDETMLSENRVNFQVNPPIRQSRENRLGLIKLLKDSQIDYLATDHAPHSIEEKAKGISGLTHLDTYGSFTTWLMEEHNFTPSDIMRIASYNPGSFINHFTGEKYGNIEKGFVGSLTVINPDKKNTVTKETLKTKSGWSPFLGVTFPGSVMMTIVKGKIYDQRK